MVVIDTLLLLLAEYEQQSSLVVKNAYVDVHIIARRIMDVIVFVILLLFLLCYIVGVVCFNSFMSTAPTL